MMRWKQLVLAIATTVAASQAFAQLSVIQQPGTVFGSFLGMNQVGPGGPPSSASIYTVPAGRYARLTDLIVSTNATSGLCYFQIDSVSTYLSYEIVVPLSGTLHLPFNNGPAYAPGEQIIISRSNRIASQCNGYLFVTARGYLFTVP